jgi:hypothetical protein
MISISSDIELFARRVYCKGVLQFSYDGATTPSRLGSSLAMLDLEFYSPLYSSSLFLSWLAISPFPAALLLHLLSPDFSSCALLQSWLPAPTQALCTSIPVPRFDLAQRIGAVGYLIPPSLGSLSQENSPGARMSRYWVSDGQAMLMVLGRSAPDKSSRTYGGQSTRSSWMPLRYMS